jgi:hypothetical protein
MEGMAVPHGTGCSYQEEDENLKLTYRIALVLALGVMIAGTVSAASVDKAGTWTPSTIYPQVPVGGPRALINDGSFENGPPAGSSWTEVSDQACEWIGDWSTAWGVSAFDGIYDYWSGGYCGLVPTSSSVTQTVLVPVGATTLSFYYIAFRPDPDDAPYDGDHAYVKVNGVEKWTLPFVQANDTYPNWVGPVTVDLSAYAGNNVSLSLGADSFAGVAGLTGNLRFDYVEFITGPTPTAQVTWGSVKSLYR